MFLVFYQTQIHKKTKEINQDYPVNEMQSGSKCEKHLSMHQFANLGEEPLAFVDPSPKLTFAMVDKFPSRIESEDITMPQDDPLKKPIK